MSYYIGGLLDEELIIASDIEAAVIHVRYEVLFPLLSC